MCFLSLDDNMDLAHCSKNVNLLRTWQPVSSIVFNLAAYLFSYLVI